MFEWLSDNRATFALVTIIGLVAAFVWSIHIGLRQTRLRAKDEVFGDPERTRGGWYWAVCGVSALMLVWFYYSWGVARAVFPQAANELCQVAKIDESIAPISAALPISSRYLKSTTLVVRNSAQLDALADGMPVEILGLQGAPNAGDEFAVVENESKAREIAEFRQRKMREAQTLAAGRGSLEQMFSAIAAGEQKELAVVIKGDVHGSVEAIATSLTKLAEDSDEVNLRVLHSGVGAINESDVTLAGSTGAMLVGFNVRANAQAREMARRDNVDIRYYSIIYNLIDDVRGLLSGLLAPTLRETFLGNAEIREVFNITKVGKVAGCYVTEGEVRRGAKVRLLRDSVVIHEGSLKTLKRFKDEVKEVKSGFECGMAFENYDDVKAGDVIECFQVEEIAREL